MKQISIQQYSTATLSQQQRLTVAQHSWLSERSSLWNVAACWHVPDAMRAHYKGYDAHWLSKELTRYFNAVDRRIFKAAHKNRGARLPRIITLEHDDAVGWHAHGLLDCAEGMNEDETIGILDPLWKRHTERFATGKFEKHISYFSYDNGNYLGYCLKRLGRQDDTQGILDTRNTYFRD